MSISDKIDSYYAKLPNFWQTIVFGFSVAVILVAAFLFIAVPLLYALTKLSFIGLILSSIWLLAWLVVATEL